MCEKTLEPHENGVTFCRVTTSCKKEENEETVSRIIKHKHAHTHTHTRTHAHTHTHTHTHTVAMAGRGRSHSTLGFHREKTVAENAGASARSFWHDQVQVQGVRAASHDVVLRRASRVTHIGWANEPAASHSYDSRKKNLGPAARKDLTAPPKQPPLMTKSVIATKPAYKIRQMEREVCMLTAIIHDGLTVSCTASLVKVGASPVQHVVGEPCARARTLALLHARTLTLAPL